MTARPISSPMTGATLAPPRLGRSSADRRIAIVPSMLDVDFAQLGDEVVALAHAGADRLQWVRPDWAGLGGDLPGRVTAVWFRGSHTDVELATPFGQVVIRALGASESTVGNVATWHIRRSWPLPPVLDEARR